MESAAERLRHARTLARYSSAADAAKRMGVPYATYAGHENGSRGFLDDAPRYAAFFQVDLEWLLTGKGNPRPKPELWPLRILEMSPEAQQTIRDMVELLEQREAARRKAG